LDAEHQRLLEAKRSKIVAFVDRWTEELKPMESKVLYALIDEVDEKLSGAANGRSSVDGLVTRIDDSLDAVTTIRGRDAFISAVLFGAAKYIGEKDCEALRQIQLQLEGAREQADWSYARVIADNAEALINSFGEAIRKIVYLRAFVAQDVLSPALDKRAMAVLRDIDESVESGDEARIGVAMAAMLVIMPEVLAEVDENQAKPPSVTGLQ
jgi:hypothetical protein